ncbi:MAG TPA: CU044_5270 family protein [Streptosporangiaceae bacterium]|jgi:hypothetical protein
MSELDQLILLRDEVPLAEPSAAMERAILESLFHGPDRGRSGGGTLDALPIQPARRPARQRRRAVLAAVAAFAVGGAAVLAVHLTGQGPDGGTGPGGRSGRPSVVSGEPVAGGRPPAPATFGRARTEAQLLDYASRSAASTPAFPPGPHQWVYVKTEVATSSAGAGGFLFGSPNERVIGQEWTRVDQRMFASYLHGHLQFSPGGADATLGGWKSTSPAYLDSLPTNPARLEAVLVASNSNPRMPWYDGAKKNYTIFDAIFTLMSDGENEGTWVPPKLQAAMYRVLADLPGVHFDATTDLVGRHGMGFYMVSSGWEKQELVINPRTYAYMGEKWAALKAHTASATDGTRYIKKGQVLGWNALLKIAVVRRAGQVP